MKMVPLSLWPPGISVEPRIPTPNTVLPVLHTGPNLASIELQEQGPENLSLPPGKKYNRMLGCWAAKTRSTVKTNLPFHLSYNLRGWGGSTFLDHSGSVFKSSWGSRV